MMVVIIQLGNKTILILVHLLFLIINFETPLPSYNSITTIHQNLGNQCISTFDLQTSDFVY